TLVCPGLAKCRNTGRLNDCETPLKCGSATLTRTALRANTPFVFVTTSMFTRMIEFANKCDLCTQQRRQRRSRDFIWSQEMSSSRKIRKCGPTSEYLLLS